MVESLLLKLVLLRKRISTLVFNCSYASPVKRKFWKPLTVCCFQRHLRIPLTFCGIYLQLPNQEQLTIFARCGFRDTTNLPKKFTLQLFVRGINGNFVSGIPLHFGTCLKISFRNPGTYRYKIARLSSEQFGLVMCPIEVVGCRNEVYLRKL